MVVWSGGWQEQNCSRSHVPIVAEAQEKGSNIKITKQIARFARSGTNCGRLDYLTQIG